MMSARPGLQRGRCPGRWSAIAALPACGGRLGQGGNQEAQLHLHAHISPLAVVVQQPRRLAGQITEIGAVMLWRGLISSSMAAAAIGSFQRRSAGTQKCSSHSPGRIPCDSPVSPAAELHRQHPLPRATSITTAEDLRLLSS